MTLRRYAALFAISVVQLAVANPPERWRIFATTILTWLMIAIATGHTGIMQTRCPRCSSPLNEGRCVHCEYEETR